MATSGRGTGLVGYNVQATADAKHHLIVAHKVTNVGHGHTQLASTAMRASKRSEQRGWRWWRIAVTSRQQKS